MQNQPHEPEPCLDTPYEPPALVPPNHFTPGEIVLDAHRVAEKIVESILSRAYAAAAHTGQPPAVEFTEWPDGSRSTKQPPKRSATLWLAAPRPTSSEAPMHVTIYRAPNGKRVLTVQFTQRPWWNFFRRTPCYYVVPLSRADPAASYFSAAPIWDKAEADYQRFQQLL